MDMDMEQIIKRIAEEVYRKLQEEERSGGGVSSGGKGEWILARMDPALRFDQMKNACAEVKGTKARTLCIPQWFVADAAETLKGSGIKVATVVGLPGGTTSPFAKYAEVKQAVTAGAEVIIIPVNMKLCKTSDWDEVRKDLAESMTPCKGRAAVYALLETEGISDGQLDMAAQTCAACGVDGIMLSAVTGGSVKEAQVGTARKAGICVGVYGGVTSYNVAEFERAGACCFASSAV